MVFFLEIGSNFEELYEGQANLKFIETHPPLPPSDKICNSTHQSPRKFWKAKLLILIIDASIYSLA